MIDAPYLQTDTTPTNIAAAVEAGFQNHPDNVAVAFPHKGAYLEITYRQLMADSNAIAHGLASVGIKRGTRAVLMVKPGPDFFALTFAMLRAGIVPVIVDPGMGIKNLKTCLDEAEPEAFIGITTAQVARLLLGWGRHSITKIVTVGPKLLPSPLWSGTTLGSLKQRGAAQETPFQTATTQADEVAAIIFTSGSTGVPKGVVYTHGNFMAQVEMIRQTFNMQPGEVDLPTFPVFALFDPAMGMTTVLPEMDFTRPAKVDPRKLIAAAERYQPSNMFGSPALLNTVGRYGEAHGAKLPSIKRVITAGAPVPPATLRRFAAMLSEDAEIFTPYGATEALPIASISSREILSETGALTDQGAGVCVGRPVDGINVHIIRIDDEPIPVWDESLLVEQGVIGEIVVNGPNVSYMYHNRPASTELAKIHTGDHSSFYHRMGDLGYFDEHGRLWYCGRKAHRVTLGDQTLYTVPAEAVFNTHEAVFRSALVGVTLNGKTEPVIIIQLEADAAKPDQAALTHELLALGAQYPHTAPIKQVLYHKDFPVDIRHNSKIFREKLGPWAQAQLAKNTK